VVQYEVSKMALESIEDALWEALDCPGSKEFEDAWGTKFTQVRNAPVLASVSECIRHGCTVTFWFPGTEGNMKFAFSCVKHCRVIHSYRFRNDKGDINIVGDNELDSYLFLLVESSLKIVVTDTSGEERSIERECEHEWKDWKWACLA